MAFVRHCSQCLIQKNITHQSAKVKQTQNETQAIKTKNAAQGLMDKLLINRKPQLNFITSHGSAPYSQQLEIRSLFMHALLCSTIHLADA